MVRNFIKAVSGLRQTFAAAFDPYRPELHYMRGPGPKWHAKRSGIANPTPPAAAVPALMRFAKFRV